MIDKKNDKTTCVVTGAAGFVGSHLARRLLELGHPVIGVDNFFSGKAENLQPLKTDSHFYFLHRSIAEKGLLAEIKNGHPGATICFHLAAIVSVPYSMEHPEESRLVNRDAAIDLLRAAADLEFDAFVFAGSAAEYGTDSRMPLDEGYATDETERLSPYGEAKYEVSMRVAASVDRPRGIALRCFNIYGPRQDPSSPYSGVISRFLSMAGDGQPLTIFGDGLQTRDFIYVSDVVEAYLAAAGLRDGLVAPPAGVYNVGTGRKTAIIDLASTIQGLTDHRESFTFYPERPGDVRHSQADISRFTAASGWKPIASLKTGLEETRDWIDAR